MATDIADNLGHETKIIIMLRNPADLVRSLCGQNTRDGDETLDLKQALATEAEHMQNPPCLGQNSLSRSWPLFVSL